MEWTLFLTMVASNIALFLWARADSRKEKKMIDKTIPLKDYTDQHLLDLIKINEVVSLNRLWGICFEILRRMNENQRLL